MSEEAGTQPAPEKTPDSIPAPAPSTYVVYNEKTQESEVFTASEMDQESKFQQALAQTPAPILTFGLIAINVAVFILMVIKGVSFMEPTTDDLLRWGADFGPLTTHGQWWRLVTCTFVHIGVMHLLMNMYILLSIGMFMEKLIGRVGFLVVYLLAGIGGSLTSLASQPILVSAGASGAVFGLYGALLGYLLRQRHEIPTKRVTALAKSAGIFIAYNVVYGLAKSQVDMAAHGGGFVTGLVLAYCLASPIVNLDAAARLRKAVITALAGAALAVLVAVSIPVVDDLRGELQKFAPLEANTLKLFNESLDNLKKNSITAQQFAQSVEKQILPPWNAERDRFAKLRTPKQQGLIKLLVQYMSLRSEGWVLMAKGATANDEAIVRNANQKQAQADEVIGKINAWRP